MGNSDINRTSNQLDRVNPTFNTANAEGFLNTIHNSSPYHMETDYEWSYYIKYVYYDPQLPVASSSSKTAVMTFEGSVV